MPNRYHFKYFNETTHRTDNSTIYCDGSTVDAVEEVMATHPTARCVYQVFKQVPVQRDGRGGQFRVDVGKTARVVTAKDSGEAAEAVEQQLHKPARNVWRLVSRHVRGRGRDYTLVEAS